MSNNLILYITKKLLYEKPSLSPFIYRLLIMTLLYPVSILLVADCLRLCNKPYHLYNLITYKLKIFAGSPMGGGGGVKSSIELKTK